MELYYTRYIAYPVLAVVLATTIVYYQTLTIESIGHKAVIALLLVYTAQIYDKQDKLHHKQTDVQDKPPSSTFYPDTDQKIKGEGLNFESLQNQQPQVSKQSPVAKQFSFGQNFTSEVASLNHGKSVFAPPIMSPQILSQPTQTPKINRQNSKHSSEWELKINLCEEEEKKVLEESEEESDAHSSEKSGQGGFNCFTPGVRRNSPEVRRGGSLKITKETMERIKKAKLNKSMMINLKKKLDWRRKSDSYEVPLSPSLSPSGGSSNKARAALLRFSFQPVLEQIDELMESNNVMEEPKNLSPDWLSLLVDSADTGLALFSGSIQQQKYQYNLCYCNTAFQVLFDINSKPMDESFNLPVFQKDCQIFTFFQLIANYKQTKSTSRHIYRICLAQAQSSPPFYVSLKFSDIKDSNKTYIGISVINLTNEQRESIDSISRKFHNTLTNAISHERLTPLNAIINGCETILKKVVPPTQPPLQRFESQQYPERMQSNFTSFRNPNPEIIQQDQSKAIAKEVEVIWSCSKAMHMLTTSQLQTLKIELHNSQPHAAPFDPNCQDEYHFRQFIQNLIKVFQIKLNGRRSTIRLFIELDNYSDLCTDYDIFTSIFFHLMQNAVKYSRSDSYVDVNIYSKPLLQPCNNLTGRLEVTIIDFGNGFNADQRQSQKFKTFQLEGTNQSDIQGVGIGLSTSYFLADYLGGELKVCSSRQQGTTATFSVVTTSLRSCANYNSDLKQYKMLQYCEVDQVDTQTVDTSSILDFYAKHLSHKAPQQLQQVPENLKFSCVDFRSQFNRLQSNHRQEKDFGAERQPNDDSSDNMSQLSTSEHAVIHSFKSNLYKEANLKQAKGHIVFSDSDFSKIQKQEIKSQIMQPAKLAVAMNPKGDITQLFGTHKEAKLQMKLLSSDSLKNLKKVDVSKSMKVEKKSKEYSNCTELCEKQIVIVDDDDFNLFTLKSMVEDLGLSCLTFLTGKELVKVFQQRLQQECCSRTFELVLTDIQMPEMNGFQVSEHINATQKGWFAAMKKMHSLQRYKADRLCPIVAVTAFTNQNVIVQAAKCGISEVINKPVSQERLIEILVKYTNIM